MSKKDFNQQQNAMFDAQRDPTRQEFRQRQQQDFQRQQRDQAKQERQDFQTNFGALPGAPLSDNGNLLPP